MQVEWRGKSGAQNRASETACGEVETGKSDTVGGPERVDFGGKPVALSEVRLWACKGPRSSNSSGVREQS